MPLRVCRNIKPGVLSLLMQAADRDLLVARYHQDNLTEESSKTVQKTHGILILFSSSFSEFPSLQQSISYHCLIWVTIQYSTIYFG